MLNRNNRFIISGGNRRDVEQIGVSLTATNDVLGRSYASSAVFTTGTNNKLTNINLTTATVELEPVKILILGLEVLIERFDRLYQRCLV